MPFYDHDPEIWFEDVELDLCVLLELEEMLERLAIVSESDIMQCGPAPCENCVFNIRSEDRCRTIKNMKERK